MVDTEAGVAETPTTESVDSIPGSDASVPEPEANTPDDPVETQADEGGETADTPTPDADAASAEGAETPEGEPTSLETLEDVTIPEGSQMDQDALDAWREFAEQYELSPDATQALINREASWLDEQRNGLAEQVNSWADEIEADPEFGGEALATNIALARSFIDNWWGSEFLQSLQDSGLGNEPRFLRGVIKLARSREEPSDVARGGPGATPGGLNVPKLFPNTDPEAMAPKD